MWCQGGKASLPCWEGRKGVSSPFFAAFSPCLIPTSAAQGRRALWSRAHQETRAPSFSFCKALSSSRTVGQGRQGTAHLLQACARALRPLVPSCQREDGDHGRVPPFSFQTPLLPVAPSPVSLAQASPLCCRKPWFGVLGGGKGAEVLPREQSCPLQTEPGPETLLLLPSQAPLSACHQNSIPSASPAVFGHSSLPPVKEQLVVAAYVSVCRVREGGGEKGPSQQFLFLNVFFFVLFRFFKVNVFDCLETFLTLFLSGLV